MQLINEKIKEKEEIFIIKLNEKTYYISSYLEAQSLIKNKVNKEVSLSFLYDLFSKNTVFYI